jgi:transcriptional regulator GlxA family with amidase domain
MRCREYVGRLRAEHARILLLTTDRPITEIAFAAGFQSISQFNRIFRAMHGSSPQDLRREKAKG